MNICPWQTRTTNKPDYSDCCQLFHLETHIPQTAEQLMRSRYSAFVLAEDSHIDYIVATTLPAQQVLLDKQGIANWARQTNWSGLEIIEHLPKIGKRHAQVEFKAYFAVINISEGQQAHHELSTFVQAVYPTSLTPSITNMKFQKRWYFLDPTVQMSLSQKQPCLCGSGEKFKRCCGPYLNPKLKKSYIAT